MNFAFLATSFWNTPSSEMTKNINCMGSVMLRTLRFFCAIYLRGVSAGKAQVSFVIGKSKLVITHQKRVGYISQRVGSS